MDPVGVILTALAAGATTAAKDTASQAVRDAYTGLRTLIQKRFANKPKAEQALAEYETNEEMWQKPLQESLAETGADRDETIIRQAKHVLQLVKTQQASQGKYNVQIGEGRGIVIGDQAEVEQHFANE